ncbi:hypothetical protein ACETK8_20025 (plasmid) [Brevundimonas staleyi]|uniref:Uncharacterized protein n=1 Tax=Brevundimonas staleyi TaxID=74326 RepID=A0ABW0FNJ0_9CAUL
MPLFDVIAAQDLPCYGAFTIEAATPHEALNAAVERLRDGAVGLDRPQADCAHGLRIVALQLNDEDPLYEDVDLDVDAPTRTRPQLANALLRTTLVLTDLIASLGEEDQYPDALAQVAENLRLVDPVAAAVLLARRQHDRADDWLVAVADWARRRCDGRALDVPSARDPRRS